MIFDIKTLFKDKIFDFDSGLQSILVHKPQWNWVPENGMKDDEHINLTENSNSWTRSYFYLKGIKRRLKRQVKWTLIFFFFLETFYTKK